MILTIIVWLARAFLAYAVGSAIYGLFTRKKQIAKYGSALPVFDSIAAICWGSLCIVATFMVI